MAATGSPLPDDVIEALRRGDILEAVKRLRAAGGVSLREAKRLIDGQARTGASQAAALPTASATVRPALHTGVGFPPAVVTALAHGHKLEAIRLLREHSGLGLKEAKDAIEASPLSMVAGSGGLSPGEVPRSRDSVWPLVAAVIAVLVWWFWRRQGG
ncbi:ribosomal protein L7/L12 [Ideonella sp. A 288]|uniref:ribosomal protein L7/L12 n=1 Tax=Ideonella sp. A 288 TaxID=1962181 RepID=UPI000B4A7FE0|nr:ribosomal protein L7/L12 [Ideonella sp. A 288]